MSEITTSRRRAFVAGSGLTAAQYHIVRLDTDGSVILATNSAAVGILINQPAAHDTATVTLRNAEGTEKIILGSGGCSVGDLLTSDTNGHAVVVSDSLQEVVGIAQETGIVGDVIEVILTNRAMGPIPSSSVSPSNSPSASPSLSPSSSISPSLSPSHSLSPSSSISPSNSPSLSPSASRSPSSSRSPSLSPSSSVSPST